MRLEPFTPINIFPHNLSSTAMSHFPSPTNYRTFCKMLAIPGGKHGHQLRSWACTMCHFNTSFHTFLKIQQKRHQYFPSEQPLSQKMFFCKRVLLINKFGKHHKLLPCTRRLKNIQHLFHKYLLSVYQGPGSFGGPDIKQGNKSDGVPNLPGKPVIWS